MVFDEPGFQVVIDEPGFRGGLLTSLDIRWSLTSLGYEGISDEPGLLVVFDK